MMLSDRGGLLTPQEALARLGITPAFLTESRGVDAIASFFAQRGAGEHGIGVAPAPAPVTIGTINVRSQADLDYIAALVGAQEEVAAAAPPDAPGQ